MQIGHCPTIGTLVAITLLAAVSTFESALAQLHCPGTWTGGMCRCPDGSWANGVGAWPNLRIVCPEPQYSPPPQPHHEAYPVKCGSWSCEAGYQCARIGRCIPEGNTDCTRDFSCRPGTICYRGQDCVAPEQADAREEHEREQARKRAEAEAEKRREAAADRKRREDERKDAARRAEEQKTKAAKQKEEERKAAAKRSYEQRQEAAEKKFKEAETARKSELAKQVQNKVKEAEIKKQENANKAALGRAIREKVREATQPPAGGPARLSILENERRNLWPEMGVPSGGPSLPMDKRKVAHDWDTLNLSRASYSDTLKRGDVVFKNNQDWRVEDKREDKASGFLAYAFLNEKEGKIVVGVQGSRGPHRAIIPGEKRDVYQDWITQDAKAVAFGKIPTQFRAAEAYVRDIKSQYGDRYVVDCTGHSLGGGACSYAASQIPGVHAVVINPISANSVATQNAYLIDNYVVPGDLAQVVNKGFERGLTGWAYQIPDPLTPSSGVAQSTPSIVVLGNEPVGRHFADRALEAIRRNQDLTALVPAD